MTPAINATTPTGMSVGNGSAPLVKDATQDRFLKLLIAQMKNQDPLNPLDNAQVTSQLAQISTVQGIGQLNDSLGTMLGQIQATQAIALTGHQVLIDGSSLTLASTPAGLSAKGGFDLAQHAERVIVDVKNSQGQVVAQLNLGAQDAGPGAFTWDGQLSTGGAAPAGKYTFEVKAYAGAAPVTAVPLMAARVEGTAITAQGVRLTLEGMASRYYSDIRMVL